VFVIYALFADFSVLRKKEATPAIATVEEVQEHVENSVAGLSRLSHTAIVPRSESVDGAEQPREFSRFFAEQRTQN